MVRIVVLIAKVSLGLHVRELGLSRDDEAAAGMGDDAHAHDEGA